MGGPLDFFADWAKQKRRWPLLLLLAIPAIFKLVQSYFGSSFQATLRHPIFLSLSAAAILLSLGLYFALAYSERIRYSPLLNNVRSKFKKKTIRLIVSDEVAWHVLSEKTPDGTVTSTLATMLAELGKEVPARVVVMKAASLDGLAMQESDGLILRGKSQSLSLLLNASLVMNEARVNQFAAEIQQPVVLPSSEDNDVVLILPPSRFLRSRFLYSHFSPETPLRVDVHGENAMAAARMVLRCALATMLSYDNNPLAARLFREVVSDAKLLPGIQSAPLANLVKTAAYYFALREQNLELAIEALGLAHQFATNDAWTEIVRAYLLLASGKRGEAGEIIDHITAGAESSATLLQLKGEYFRNIERPSEAVEAYEKALALITDTEDAPSIHLAIALVYGMFKHATAQERSDQMISHLEEAIARDPKTAVFHVMQGYAWAMQGNSELSQRAFARGEALCTSDGERGLLEYWRGRAGLELGQYEQTVKQLEERFGDLDKVTDPSKLLILAQNLMNVPGREAEAEKYIDRILDAGEPEEGKVYRYKGLAIVARMYPDDLDSKERLRLNDEARAYLLKATRTDDENSSTHNLLAKLYLDANDRVNATKHARRGAELDPLDPAPLLTLADLASDSGNLDQAFALLEKVRVLLPNDVDVELKEGLARQRAGQMEEARYAYKKALKLDPKSEAGHSNLAFVLFDLNEIDEALTHWEAALEINPESADSLAGKAIGLARKGNPDAALEAYRTATAKNPDFLDVKIMQKDFLWSAEAAETAKPLIAKLQPEQSQRAAG